jgi:hypothetical protein
LSAKRRRSQPAGFGRCLLAGVGAGIVAALAARAASALLHTRIPPVVPSEGSAFAGAMLGGLLYWLLARVSRRPAAWLWGIGLAAATGISLVVALLPGAAVRIPSFGYLNGLTAPLGQLLALVGLAKFGRGRFPAQGLPTAILMHYLTAVAAGLLVPRLAGGSRR